VHERRIVPALALAVLAAGCGSGPAAERTRAPQLPRALAQRLAAESDAVAAALARGDACGASRLAERLRADATVSIGRVPRAFQEPLSSGVNAVVASVPACPPPTTTATSTDEGEEGQPAEREHHRGHGHGRGKGHGKHKDHGEGDD
jgi:hypothetical protein